MGTETGETVAERFDDLFADLGGQLDAAFAGELAAEVEDRSRREAALVRLADRLHAATGQVVQLQVTAGTLSGHLVTVGADWLELRESTDRRALVPLSRVTSVGGLGSAARAPASEGAVTGRLDLRHVLRTLARNRAPLRILLLDGRTLLGTLDRVGADYVDVAEHPADEARRSSAVRRTLAVPLPAIVVVRFPDPTG